MLIEILLFKLGELIIVVFPNLVVFDLGLKSDKETGGNGSPDALCDGKHAVASRLSQPAGYCFNRLWVPRLYLGIRKRRERLPLGRLPLAAH